jgi:hypothetical protein
MYLIGFQEVYKQNLLGKQLNLDQVLDLACLHEKLQLQTKTVLEATQVVNKLSIRKRDNGKQGQSQSKAKCFRCGKGGHYRNNKSCPAWGTVCV